MAPNPTAPKESFAALLDESLGIATGLEGTVVKGTGDRDRERRRRSSMSA